MKKILITGSSGLLGLNLINFLKKKKILIKVLKRTKSKNFEKLNFCLEFLKKNKFDVIINLSAITDIDFCEKNKKIAKNVNFKIVKNICESIKKNKLDTFLIHLSTDQFYYKFNKNNEELKTYKNFYCKTKLLSEFECLKINSAILRTNFIGKSLKKNRLSFSDWIYKDLTKGKKIYLASDILFSPLSIHTVCKIILMVLNKKINGIFNIGSRNGYSKYHFGLKFAKKLKLNKNLIIKSEYQNIRFFAKRNKDMRMRIHKFEKTFNYKFNTFDQELVKIVKYYKK